MQQTKLVNVKEAANALSVSERFLRQLVKQNRVTFYQLSARTTRFDLDELRDYMRHIAESESQARCQD